MAVFRKNRSRGAPRIRLSEQEEAGVKNIRFTSSKYSNVLTSSIHDVSETGISFTCTSKLAPEINEIIKLELVPFRSVHIACLGRVVRIETPSAHSKWNRFPSTVKVGVTYHEMPHSYRKTMSQSVKAALIERDINPNEGNGYYYPDLTGTTPLQTDFAWLKSNWVSLMITIFIIIGSIVLGMVVIDNVDSRKPAAATEWSQNFFEKIKTEKK